MNGPARRRTERLIALVVAAALVFNYPVLTLFGGGGAVFGIPLLYLYLFGAWIVVIAAVGLTMSDRRPRRDDPSSGE